MPFYNNSGKLAEKDSQDRGAGKSKAKTNPISPLEISYQIESACMLVPGVGLRPPPPPNQSQVSD